MAAASSSFSPTKEAPLFTPSTTHATRSHHPRPLTTLEKIESFVIISAIIAVVGTALLAIAAVAVGPLALTHKISPYVATKMLIGFGAAGVTALALIFIAIGLQKNN